MARLETEKEERMDLYEKSCDITHTVDGAEIEHKLIRDCLSLLAHQVEELSAVVSRLEQKVEGPSDDRSPFGVKRS